ETLWGTIAANERELATLEAQIASRERLLARVDTRQLLGVSGTLAFVVLLVHLLVYLYRAKDPPLPFRPALFVALAILLLFAAPLFAAENVEQDLSDTNRLLGATPAERGLYWLGHLVGQGTMPADIEVK